MESAAWNKILVRILDQHTTHYDGLPAQRCARPDVNFGFVDIVIPFQRSYSVSNYPNYYNKNKKGIRDLQFNGDSKRHTFCERFCGRSHNFWWLCQDRPEDDTSVYKFFRFYRGNRI
ncbi:PREDICTED: uncharacterized protein LOC106741956 [Dinoponera quadriceps]|uniref:Uncharacterized protein LOC106741956 n=1 Tax=Dinoponera quadriceps TaxID=609295 RepID=A0A6P3WUZ8_DINQU|nr:PREDICTED: uncharacterized protein LOC106741956 [Dinoponera quadriceps]